MVQRLLILSNKSFDMNHLEGNCNLKESYKINSWSYCSILISQEANTFLSIDVRINCQNDLEARVNKALCWFLVFQPIFKVCKDTACLTLSLLDGPYSPKTNTGKDNFSGGQVQKIVNILMAVFYNSLRFHQSYLTMLPPAKRGIIWVLTANWI